MAAVKLEISSVLIFAIICSRSTGTEAITPVGKILIDTDAGGDDASAIIIASGAEKHINTRVVGITCVNGNADVNSVTLNVLKILKVIDRLDIPVYKGADHPLLLANKKDYYFGRDGFGDFYYPDPPSVDLVQEKHAVNAMIDLVKENPGEVTLVALGPLTNVALAIRMYPSFLDDLQQLIVMGGSTEGRGITRPGIEFNFHIDPVANYVVFNSSTSKPTILIPWETTLRPFVPIELMHSLNESAPIKYWLIYSAEFFNSSLPEEDYWHCPDLVTMAITLSSGSIVTKSDTCYSEAIYDGARTAGMIIVDYVNVTGYPANTHLIQDIDKDIYHELILKYFNS